MKHTLLITNISIAKHQVRKDLNDQMIGDELVRKVISLRYIYKYRTGVW